MTGYSSKEYAQSLSDFGTPIYLENSKTWVLERQIQNSNYKDAMGCYPLFLCGNMVELEKDFQSKRNEWVSFSIVTDPFGDINEHTIKTIFPDKNIHFKNHHIVNLRSPIEITVSKHHKYYSHKALKEVKVQVVHQPQEHLHEWSDLYNNLIKRHKIEGIQAFSENSFKKQLSVPGAYLFRAAKNGVLQGMQIWFEEDGKVYHHLSAYSNEGYKNRTSYAMLWEALNFFKYQNILFADLGAGAGLEIKDDGLTKFKKGWGDKVLPVYLCGKILNRPVYRDLCDQTQTVRESYFPKYRTNE